MSLKTNQITGQLTFDPKEGRVVRKDEILPSPGKHRSEAYAFMEGVAWTLEHMIGYKSSLSNIPESAKQEALTLYPDW